jgi:hypothetical protein
MSIFFEASVSTYRTARRHTPQYCNLDTSVRLSLLRVWCMTTGTNDRAQSTVDAETSSNNKFSSRTRLLFLLTAYRLLVNNRRNRRFLAVAPAVGRGHLQNEQLWFRWTRRPHGLCLCYTLLQLSPYSD